MTRGLYGDPAALPRDVLVALSRACGGTATSRASSDDGQWFLHGRSDDTIKVAGKRLGPAEVETVVVAHPAVLEAAAVGVPDDLKGEALWVFVVPGARRARRRRAARRADRDAWSRALGPSFKPAEVRFTTRAAEDAQREGAAPRDPLGRHRRPTRATCRVSKIRPRSTRSRAIASARARGGAVVVTELDRFTGDAAAACGPTTGTRGARCACGAGRGSNGGSRAPTSAASTPRSTARRSGRGAAPGTASGTSTRPTASACSCSTAGSRAR